MPGFDKNILISNIKRLMKEKDITQPKLAEALHIGQPSISKYLNGKQQMSIDVAYNLAQCLGVTLDDLCKDPNEPSALQDSPTIDDPFKYDFQKVCGGLATVFKYADLRTKEIDIQEVIYAEEVTPEGYETGVYARQKTILNTDPTNKYNTFYFPNYHEICSTFPSREARDEYMSDLHYLGNANEPNMDINAFFKKLCDLNCIYQNGSITYEAYTHAISSNLQEFLNKKGARD